MCVCVPIYKRNTYDKDSFVYTIVRLDLVLEYRY